MAAYLLKLNELRGATQETQMEIWKRTEFLSARMKQYRSKYEPIFNTGIEENSELAFKNFKAMSELEREQFLKRSVDLFEGENEIEQTYKSKIKNLSTQIEAIGLQLKKEALINLHSNKLFFEKQRNLFKKLDSFTIKRKSIEASEEYSTGLIGTLESAQEILIECHDFEFLILVELKKL